MKKLFTQRKKNRLLSALESARLSTRNLFSRERVVSPEGPVVSLTTHGPRLQKVFIAIEAIGRGLSKPSRLLLWLDEELRGKPLPDTLRRLQSRGLDVRYCRNLGPHKKYYPFVESESDFVVPLVTADDDVIYPEYWLDELMAAFRARPECINCFRAQRIGVTPEGLLPYSSWQANRGDTPSHLAFSTGVSGVVFPPRFVATLKRRRTEFESCCPRADDIWLNVMALRSGYKVRQVREAPIHFVAIMGTQRSSLNRSNVKEGGNDKQLAATYGPDDLALLQEALRLEA